MALRAQPIKMGMHKVTGLQDATDTYDAVNLGQVAPYINNNKGVYSLETLGVDLTGATSAVSIFNSLYTISDLKMIVAPKGSTVLIDATTRVPHGVTYDWSNVEFDASTLANGKIPMIEYGGDANNGGYLGTAINVSGTLAKGDTVITCSASVAAVTAGSWIDLSSTDNFASSSAKALKLEVAAVDTGTNTITLREPLPFAFATSIKVKPFVGGENTRIIGGRAYGSYAGSSGTQLATRISYGLRTRVEGWEAWGFDYSGLDWIGCIGGRRVHGGGGDSWGSGLAYGDLLATACFDMDMQGCSFKNVRHIRTVSSGAGTNRDIRASHNHATGCREGIDAHPNCLDVDYSFNTLIASDLAESDSDGAMLQGGGLLRAVGNKFTNFIGTGMSAQVLTTDPDILTKVDFALNQIEMNPNKHPGYDASPAYSSGTNSKICFYIVNAASGNGGLSVSLLNNKYNGGDYDMYIHASSGSIAGLHIHGNQKTSADAGYVPANSRGIFISAATGKTIKDGTIGGNRSKLHASSTAENLYISSADAGGISEINILPNIAIGGSRAVRLINTDKVTVAPGRHNVSSGWLQQSGDTNTIVLDGYGATLKGSATYDPPNLADGAGATTTVTVTGAALGDFVDKVSFSLDLQGITLTAWVSAANTVSVRFQNESGGPLDLLSGTLTAIVKKNY